MEALHGISDEQLLKHFPALLARADKQLESSLSSASATTLSSVYGDSPQVEVVNNETTQQGGSVTLNLQSDMGFLSYEATLSEQFSWDGYGWTIESCTVSDSALEPICPDVTGSYQIQFNDADDSPMYSVTITEQDDEFIRFNFGYSGRGGSPEYVARGNSAVIDGEGIAHFSNWHDTWLNTGDGTLAFVDDGVVINVWLTHEADWNRATLAREDLFIPKVSDDSFGIAEHQQSEDSGNSSFAQAPWFATRVVWSQGEVISNQPSSLIDIGESVVTFEGFAYLGQSEADVDGYPNGPGMDRETAQGPDVFTFTFDENTEFVGFWYEFDTTTFDGFVEGMNDCQQRGWGPGIVIESSNGHAIRVVGYLQ